MKAVIQRVKSASVQVEGTLVGKIGKGYVVFLCVERGDDERILSWFADKIANLRLFSDPQGKFNLSLKDVSGEVLLVSNFTVCGTLKKGTRPSFHLAAAPSFAESKLTKLRELLEACGIPTKVGIFGAHMEVDLINDGPVTVVLEKSLTNNQS